MCQGFERRQTAEQPTKPPHETWRSSVPCLKRIFKAWSSHAKRVSRAYLFRDEICLYPNKPEMSDHSLENIRRSRANIAEDGPLLNHPMHLSNIGEERAGSLGKLLKNLDWVAIGRIFL